MSLKLLKAREPSRTSKRPIAKKSPVLQYALVDTLPYLPVLKAKRIAQNIYPVEAWNGTKELRKVSKTAGRPIACGTRQSLRTRNEN